MPENQTRQLSDVLDKLESSVEGDSTTIRHIVEKLGHSSFASVMLAFSLVSTSPASAIPGLTAFIGIIVAVLVVQMIIGRTSLWLPRFVMCRPVSKTKLCKGIGWLRKPVRFVERFVRPRWTFLFHRPWLWLPLILILCLASFMPFMELVPTSGSIASAVIALFAAGLLTKDGALALVAFLVLLTIPLAIWQIGFA